MNHPNYQPPKKKLPPKFVVEFEEFKTLTWRERWQILLGFNLRVCSKVIVDKRNESVKAGSTIWLTKHLNPQDQVRANVSETV